MVFLKSEDIKNKIKYFKSFSIYIYIYSQFFRVLTSNKYFILCFCLSQLVLELKDYNVFLVFFYLKGIFFLVNFFYLVLLEFSNLFYIKGYNNFLASET